MIVVPPQNHLHCNIKLLWDDICVAGKKAQNNSSIVWRRRKRKAKGQQYFICITLSHNGLLLYFQPWNLNRVLNGVQLSHSLLFTGKRGWLLGKIMTHHAESMTWTSFYLAWLLASGGAWSRVAVELWGTGANFIVIVLFFIKIHTAGYTWIEKEKKKRFFPAVQWQNEMLQ